MVTNLTKSTVSLGTVGKSSGAQLIWNNASNTWDNETGTWDDPGQVLGAIAKSTVTKTAVTKSS